MALSDFVMCSSSISANIYIHLRQHENHVSTQKIQYRIIHQVVSGMAFHTTNYTTSSVPPVAPYGVVHPMNANGPVAPQGYFVPQAHPPAHSAMHNPHLNGRRLLHLYNQGTSRRVVRVLDSDNATPLYTINANRGGLFSSKPHMTVQNVTTGAMVGTVNFHSMSSTIDVQIHGKTMLLDRVGLFSREREFRSATCVQTFKWKRDGMSSGGNLKCVDQSDQVVATFEAKTWATKKDSKFELAATVQGPLIDELMVTGVAIAEYQRRQKAAAETSTSAADAAVAVSGAASGGGGA